MDYISKFVEAREEFIKSVLNDSSLSKTEKLNRLSSYEVYPIDSCIPDLFSNWEIECAELEEKCAIANGKIPGKDYICKLTDIPLLYCEDKYRTIYYVDLIDELEDSERDEKGNILIVTCRGEYRSELYKSEEEIIDAIYDYAIKTKTIGFTYDW